MGRMRVPVPTTGSAPAYDWIGDWAELPGGQPAGGGWAHTGLVLGPDRTVLAVHPDIPLVLVLDREGSFRRSFAVPVTEAHGLALDSGPDGHVLWVADPGFRLRVAGSEINRDGPGAGRVVGTDLTGSVVRELQPPDHPAYKEGPYKPTAVVVDRAASDGPGDVWVADGYGQSLVHRYSPDGEYLRTISGDEGRGARFNTPHSIFIDRRRSDPELFVADRGNQQVQVFDLDGVFKRAFGGGELTSPSGFAVTGDQLIVAELRARLAVFDPAERLLGYLGDNDSAADLAGWPNQALADGRIVPSEALVPGLFNSPHAIAADEDGSIYVAEFLLGGRFSKLRPAER